MRDLKKVTVSRANPSGARFSLVDLPTHKLLLLGKQLKDPSTIHTIYIRRNTIGNTCFVQPKVKITGYCSYSLVCCDNTGIVGVLFYSFKDKTVLNDYSLSVTRGTVEPKPDEEFSPLFILEKLDLYVYCSNYGSTLVIPTQLGKPKYLVSAG